MTPPSPHFFEVLVLEAGAVQEFPSPASLLANQDSAFASMARDAGIVV